MSFDKSTFKSIYDELVFTHKDDSYDSLDHSSNMSYNLLQLGLLLGQCSLALNHSNESTCSIHEENVQNYQQFAMSNLNNCSKKDLLCDDNIDVNLNPSDFKECLNLSCRDEYLDCNIKRISMNDIESLCRTTSEPNNPENKRSFVDDAVSTSEKSEKKFVFRETKANSIVRAPPAVQLDKRIPNESHSKFVNFDVQQNQSDLKEQPVNKDAESDALKYKASERVATNTKSYDNYQNMERNPKNNVNRQPLFLFDKNKKTIGSDSIANANSKLFSFNKNKKPVGSNPRNTKTNSKSLFSYHKTKKALGAATQDHQHQTISSFHNMEESIAITSDEIGASCEDTVSGMIAAPKDMPSFDLSDNNLTTIKNITQKDGLKIRARITIKSDEHSFKDYKGQMGVMFTMDLIDETGEIRLTAFGNCVKQFYDSVEVNKIYYFSKFLVNRSDQTKSLIHVYDLRCDATTQIIPCTKASDLPKLSFNFKSINHINKLNKNEMVDIIAICESYEECVPVKLTKGFPGRKREIWLVDQSAKIMLTIWGSNADKFGINHQPGCVIAVKRARVTDWRGKSLDSSCLSSSTFQVNPDLPEAHMLRTWHNKAI